MVKLFSLWLASPATAETPTETDPGAELVANATFRSVLDEAKERYFGGDSARAQELLESLQLRLYGGEQPGRELVVEALTYLGEIQYNQGSVQQAELTFRFLLEQDPDTPISPYHHSLDVVSLFESVRRDVVQERQVLTPPDLPPPLPPETAVEVPPLPPWTFAPLGVPQFAQGRPLAGLGYGAVQVGFATASVAVSLQLARAREAAELGDREELQRLGWDPDTYGSAFQQRRYLVQWPVTFAFYLTWGFSAIDAARWHQGHPPPLQVGTTPAGTPVLSVHSRL